MGPRPVVHAVRAALTLLAVATLLLPIYALRALPAIDPASNELALATAALAAGVLGLSALATVTGLGVGLRDGAPAPILLAGASAALAGGAAATLAGWPVFTLPLTAAAALTCAAAAADSRPPPAWTRRARVAAACGVIVLAEAAVVVELVPPLAEAIAAQRPWLLIAAAVLAALATVIGASRDVAPAGAALAVGAIAFSVAREGGVELLMAPIALIGALLLMARASIGVAQVSAPRDGSPPPELVPEPALSGDAERLSRELRGTIEELMQARRTIELQRVELERALTTDPITAIASRAAILGRLRIEVAEARRYDHPITILLMDLDRFAEINAAHGIASGDEVLREVALRIRMRVRAADAIGRAGSARFLAILPHTDESGGATFADTLRRRVAERPIPVGGADVGISVSVGVAVMRAGEDLDLDGLLARAEEALSSARSAGGDRIALDRLHGLARLERPSESADEARADPG